MSKGQTGKTACWIALVCLMVPMFASYFFDDMFSTLSQIFQQPQALQLGWDSTDYGFYAGGYSFLCVCGGLVVCGILLDIFGVRIIGSVFVGLMALGAGIVLYALRSGLEPSQSLTIAYIGCMLFGLGSEIAGVAVTRSIAKWFKGRNVAFAMGAQVAVARLGTAAAFIISPMLVARKDYYSLEDTSRPAMLGLLLIFVGVLLWGIFIAMDKRFDSYANANIGGSAEEATGENGSNSAAKPTARTTAKPAAKSKRGSVKEEDKFRFSDLAKLLSNRRFLLISLLCVFFYCCIISFKKFGTSIVIPRFGMEVQSAKWVITMIPFFTVVFTPLFGALVDRKGKATLWMIIGSVMVLGAHLLLRWAPQGVPFWGYFSIAILGVGYSLVPSAMWPSVPKIVPERNLGTAYSLIYWIQNMGMLLVPIFVGKVFNSRGALEAAQNAEYIFIALGCIAVFVALLLMRSSHKHPELKLDQANVQTTR